MTTNDESLTIGRDRSFSSYSSTSGGIPSARTVLMRGKEVRRAGRTVTSSAYAGRTSKPVSDTRRAEWRGRAWGGGCQKTEGEEEREERLKAGPSGCSLAVATGWSSKQVGGRGWRRRGAGRACIDLAGKF